MATISEEDAKRYDRQIRLWGLEAQSRIQGAAILVMGMGGLAAEMCKNLVLAGVGSLTIVDHACATEDDAVSQLLVAPADRHRSVNRAEASMQRLQTLNPNVRITVRTDHYSQLPEDFYGAFHIVCATHLPFCWMAKINEITRRHGIRFFATDSHGFFGYLFLDLLQHSYVDEKEQASAGSNNSNSTAAKSSTAEEAMKQVSYVPLSQSLHLNWSTLGKRRLATLLASYLPLLCLHEFWRQNDRLPSLPDDESQLEPVAEHTIASVNLPSESRPTTDDLMKRLRRYAAIQVCPVTAILGAFAAQEVIKVLSGKRLPIRNFFFFDAIQKSGIIEYID